MQLSPRGERVELTTLNAPFRVEAVDTSYEILDTAGIEHLYTRVDTVVPQHPARFFERRYRWSGTTTGQALPEILSTTDGVRHSVHGPLLKEDSDIVFIVDLGNTIAQGRKIQIKTRQKLFDEGRTFKPYLRHRVSQGTGQLRVAVRLPGNLAVNLRPLYMDGSARAHHDIPRKVLFNVDPDGRGAVLEVKQPRIGYIYGIEWLS